MDVKFGTEPKFTDLSHLHVKFDNPVPYNCDLCPWQQVNVIQKYNYEY